MREIDEKSILKIFKQQQQDQPQRQKKEKNSKKRTCHKNKLHNYKRLWLWPFTINKFFKVSKQKQQKISTSAKSGNPMKLQYACTMNGAAKCPVLSLKKKSEWTTWRSYALKKSMQCTIQRKTSQYFSFHDLEHTVCPRGLDSFI